MKSAPAWRSVPVGRVQCGPAGCPPAPRRGDHGGKLVEPFRGLLSRPLVDGDQGVPEAMDRLDSGGGAAARLVVADHAWRDAHVMGEVRLRYPQLFPPFPHRLPWLLGEGDLSCDFFAQRELHGASEKASDI